MSKILIPVDGSEASAAVLKALPAWLARLAGPAEIHLINVQHPVGQDVGQFVGHDKLQDFHREEGLKALAAVHAGLAAAGIEAGRHVLVGEDAALVITGFAREQGCDAIFMTTHGRGALAKLFLGSIAAEVVRLADVPVTLVK